MRQRTGALTAAAPNLVSESVAFSDSQEDTCLLYKNKWYIRQYLIAYPKNGD